MAASLPRIFHQKNKVIVKRNGSHFLLRNLLINNIVHIVKTVTKSLHGSLNTMIVNFLFFENRYTFCNGSVTKNVTIVTIFNIDYQIVKPSVLRFCYGKNTSKRLNNQSNTYYKPILNRNKNEKSIFQP